LRSETFPTLFGLLYVSGIRVGELIALNTEDLDVDEATLLIKKGKFGKSRSLPLRPSTVEALTEYLRCPLRTASTCASGPFFVSSRGRFAYSTIRRAFHAASKAAGLRGQTRRYPRVHDLRHSFAAQRVISWYEAGRDVNELLAPLSTYLGHADVSDTLTYLKPTETLLRLAAKRFEAHFGPSSSEAKA
jgi:integrase